MPGKLGFGNSRKKGKGKAEYGSPLHYKNPITKKTDKKATAKIGGRTIEGPFTEKELDSVKRMENAGDKGYTGKRSNFSVKDHKNYRNVRGNSANPFLRPSKQSPVDKK